MVDGYCIRKRRVGQWLRGRDRSGARSVMEQAVTVPVGGQVTGSRFTDEIP